MPAGPRKQPYGGCILHVQFHFQSFKYSWTYTITEARRLHYESHISHYLHNTNVYIAKFKSLYSQGPFSWILPQFKFHRKLVSAKLRCMVPYCNQIFHLPWQHSFFFFFLNHDSTAVVPCAKFYSNHLTTTWTRAEWNFCKIWITKEKLFMK